jgi:hypothetical protein
MVVLYTEDQSILDEAREQYGRVNMELGNIMLHYLPLALYWLYLLTHTRAPSLFEKVFVCGRQIAVVFTSAHLALPLAFSLLYATLFSPQEEYGKNIRTTSMASSIASFMFLNYIGVLLVLVQRIYQ